MKKFLLLFTLLFTSVFGHSQSDFFSLSVGLSNYNVNTDESSDLGFGIGITLWNVYVEASSNLSYGRGDYLEFSSSQSYETGKVSVSSYKIGYTINVAKKRLFITPFVGYAQTEKIWEDPILQTTYFKSDAEGYSNFGGHIQYGITDHIFPYVGYGTFDGFKAGLTFKI